MTVPLWVHELAAAFWAAADPLCASSIIATVAAATTLEAAQDCFITSFRNSLWLHPPSVTPFRCWCTALP